MSDSLRGQFLVAAKSLTDPNFFKTVVLMVEHGQDGAMGLVINRPSTISIQHALSGHMDVALEDDFVFVGGPVEPTALFIIHNATELKEASESILSDLYLGNSPAVFESVVRSASSGRQGLCFRVFFGCAGWAPGQLENEIRRGDWLVHPADAESAFDHDPYELWDELVHKVFEKHRILPHMPENPEWN